MGFFIVLFVSSCVVRHALDHDGLQESVEVKQIKPSLFSMRAASDPFHPGEIEMDVS